MLHMNLIEEFTNLIHPVDTNIKFTIEKRAGSLTTLSGHLETVWASLQGVS